MGEIIDVKENGPERNAKINTAELLNLQTKLTGDKATWDALQSGLKEKVDSLAQAIKTTDLSPLSLDAKKKAVEEIRKINTLATDPSGAEAFAKKILPPAIQNSHTIKVEGGKIKLVPNPGPRTESSDTPKIIAGNGIPKGNTSPLTAEIVNLQPEPLPENPNIQLTRKVKDIEIRMGALEKQMGPTETATSGIATISYNQKEYQKLKSELLLAKAELANLTKTARN